MGPEKGPETSRPWLSNAAHWERRLLLPMKAVGAKFPADWFGLPLANL